MAKDTENGSKQDDLLFDDECYKDIPDAEHALSYVRYYTRMAPVYHAQLFAQDDNWDKATEKTDMLWKRVIAGCRKHGVPLTHSAAVVAERLGI